MGAADIAVDVLKQHLIDPEICIRCNTCEETCPVDAITHDARNYVVDAARCNACLACIGPCPTGAIDNWRIVARDAAHGVDAQLGWDVLPASSDDAAASDLPAPAMPATSAAATAPSAGLVDNAPGATIPPRSAAHPQVNLYSMREPVTATVVGNFRVTADAAESDTRHIVLDFGSASFPVLEGQSIGIVPPGVDAEGRAHFARQYSVASPRDGERAGYNNLSLTVKRVTADHDGKPVRGVGSNYLCDLAKGDVVHVIGPFGHSFLMPDDPAASLVMICTGTGSAPMRAMTERRRRLARHGGGGPLMLFFGARSEGELPYFGPLTSLPREFIDVNLAYSRMPGVARCYVQDRMRERIDALATLVVHPATHIYVCGLRGMEAGVLAALAEAVAAAGGDWTAHWRELKVGGRLHFETY
ncbi:MAG: benzoyl-CoA 2,3-epoxidase subunit BoxA [Betaproteobacteria bacterium]